MDLADYVGGEKRTLPPQASSANLGDRMAQASAHQKTKESAIAEQLHSLAARPVGLRARWRPPGARRHSCLCAGPGPPRSSPVAEPGTAEQLPWRPLHGADTWWRVPARTRLPLLTRFLPAHSMVATLAAPQPELRCTGRAPAVTSTPSTRGHWWYSSLQWPDPAAAGEDSGLLPRPGCGSRPQAPVPPPHGPRPLRSVIVGAAPRGGVASRRPPTRRATPPRASQPCAVPCRRAVREPAPLRPTPPPRDQ